MLKRVTGAKNIKVAVAGCGYWGPNLLRNLVSLPECRVLAACDMNEERVRHVTSLYPGVQGEFNYERLLENRELDAVVIATPVRYHYPMAKASLLAGKHTLIEKPMAASAEQCEELIAIARKQGLVLMVGHTFLYSQPVRKIKDIVDRGDIGEIRYIAARRLNLGLYQKDINVAWDLAPHDISIILHIVGEAPVSVNCQGSAHVTPGIEDVTLLHIEFRQNKTAVVHSSWLDPRKTREMTIVGSKRMIVYDDVAQSEKIRVFDARVERPPHYDTFAEFQYAYHYGDVYAPHVKLEEPLKVECQHFLECIRTGQTPLTSGAQGLAVVKILEACSSSLKHDGKRICFEPAKVAAATGGNGNGNGNGANGNGAKRNGNRVVGNGVNGRLKATPAAILNPRPGAKVRA